MPDVKWIKLSTDLFDNRKIRQIEAMPDGDALVVIWLKLLILAGEVNDGGCVYFTRDIPYTDQLLATQFNRPLATVQLALKTFQSFGMIEVINDLILVSNWEKYQNLDGLERIREQTRERVRNYRQRQLQASNVTGNVTVTQSNAVDKDIEKEKEKNKESKHTHGEYKHVLLKDSEVDKLVAEIGKDMTDKCIAFLDEYIEMKGYKAKSHYLCIRKWVVNAVRERQPKQDYMQRSDSMDDILMDL